MTTFRLLISGQSNSIGFGSGGPEWPVIPEIRFWNNDNDKNNEPDWSVGSSWEYAECQHLPFRPDGIYQSFGFWFARRYAGFNPEHYVRGLLISRGGTSITAWTDGAEPTMRNRIADVWTASGGSGCDAFLWHQGEKDYATMPFTEWRDRFVGLVAWLRSTGIIKPDAPVIVGGLARTDAGRIAFNSDLATFAAANGYGFADSAGLPMQGGSLSHFSGDGLKTLGYRYYAEFYGI